MKKTLFATVIVITILATLAVASLAFAQSQTPPETDQPYNGRPGYGMMGAGQGMMGGRWNRSAQGSATTGEYGPIHEYMIAALAQAFNLTPEELEARHSAGETMWDIAAAQGITQEQFVETMLQARTTALSQAVDEGVMTQEQADWMLSRMNGMGGDGAGRGGAGCPGMGAGFQGRPGGGRWNQ
jgi:hypothetical protein